MRSKRNFNINCKKINQELLFWLYIAADACLDIPNTRATFQSLIRKRTILSGRYPSCTIRTRKKRILVTWKKKRVTKWNRSRKLGQTVSHETKKEWGSNVIIKRLMDLEIVFSVRSTSCPCEDFRMWVCLKRHSPQ